jgi:hypothetical protein
VAQPAFPEGVLSLWVETIFSDAFVPVIPLPQNQFETFWKNLRSRAADQRIRWKTDGSQSPSGAFVNHFEVSKKGNGFSLSVAEWGFAFSFRGEGF